MKTANFCHRLCNVIKERQCVTLLICKPLFVYRLYCMAFYHFQRRRHVIISIVIWLQRILSPDWPNVSSLNLNVNPKTGLSWPTDVYMMKTSSNQFQVVYMFDSSLILTSRELTMKLTCAAWHWHDWLLHLTRGKKTLMMFTTVLLCLFRFLCLNKQIKTKCFMIKFYIRQSDNLYTFQNT